MKDKFEIYQDAGVLEYWIVSPIEKTVQAWVLNEEKKYIGLQPLVEDDIFSTAIIPGLVIDMKEVFLD
jgi:Uma2 family endonuclease